MNFIPACVLATALALSGCAILPASHYHSAGEAAPQWVLPTSDGDSLSSARLHERPTMLVWIDPTCDAVQNAADHGALWQLEHEWSANPSVNLVLVASQKASSPDYLNPAELRTWLKENRLRSPVVLDTTQALANAWEVRTVPSAALVDTKGIIRWHGPLTVRDSASPSLSLAVEQVLNQQPVTPPDRGPAQGCLLKRKP